MKLRCTKTIVGKYHNNNETNVIDRSVFEYFESGPALFWKILPLEGILALL